MVIKTRTQDEILEKLKHLDEHGSIIHAMTRGDLIECLDYEHAKEFLKDGITKEDWDKDRVTTDEQVIAEIIRYMPFAIGKAENERGISSSRSIGHYCNWLWLIEDHELLAFAQDDSNYPMYGMPILKKIQEKYGKG